MTVFALVFAGCLAASRDSLPARPSDSAEVVGVVASFHAALRTGDSAAALGLLDRDTIILESGAAETREEYRSHHLPEDIEFARSVQSKQSLIRVAVTGSVAWIASTSISRGKFEGRQISSDGAELIVLRRGQSGWKITGIHWSSRVRRVARAGKG